MTALADRPRVLLWVGTCFAAMSLAAYYLATTARMFALVYLCHESSSEPNSDFPRVGDLVGEYAPTFELQGTVAAPYPPRAKRFPWVESVEAHLCESDRESVCACLCRLRSESIFQSTDIAGSDRLRKDS